MGDPVKSIMQRKDGICYLCAMLDGDESIKRVQEHHAIFGTSRRKLSEKYGLKVYLCLRHHEYGPDAVHRNAKMALLIKQEGQRAFLLHWPELDFREVFGKNYLGDDSAWQQDKTSNRREISVEEGIIFTGLEDGNEKES